MQVHLTEESQGVVHVAPCKNVPAACKEFYIAEQLEEHEDAKSREKEATRTKIYNQAVPLSRSDTEKKRKAAEEEHCKDSNPIHIVRQQ